MIKNDFVMSKRNNSIDIFRYVASFMVIIIHSSFWKNSGTLGYFIGEIFPRIAVPFFFATTGYFYIKDLLNGKKVFLVRVKQIIKIYTLWSLIYFLFDFLNQILLDGENFLQFVKEYLINYLFFGSYFHFWYFPALVFALCFVTLIHKFGLIKFLIPITIVLFLAGCFGTSYFAFGEHIPVLKNIILSEYFYSIRCIFSMGFPFFSAGYIIFKLQDRYNIKTLILAWIAIICVFLMEIIMLKNFNIAATVVITPMLYPLLIITMLLFLNLPLYSCTKISKTARDIANFTYYSHPLFQTFLILFFDFVNIKISPILLFVLLVFTTTVVGYILHKLKEITQWKILSLLIG